jgi:lipoate-protein ligase A
MKIIKNENTSLSFNMAAELYLMDQFDEDIFMLWRATPSVLIGKNQNTYEEIYLDYVNENKIDVVRRKSGGGTVFCDLGNTNFAFITSDAKAFSDFRRFTRPILEVLKKLNVPAEFSGRNDLTIEGKKFSGNAQYKHKNRLLHHGTLLFDADLSTLAKAIHPNKLKLQSKGIASVRSRVTNIAAYLEKPLDILGFRKMINEHIFESIKEAHYYEFTPDDLQAIKKIQNEIFDNWEWNYGNSPKFEGSHMKKFEKGSVKISFNAKNSILKAVAFTGDFFSKQDVSDIELALLETPYTKEAIEEVLSNFNLEDYFTGITKEEIVTLFFEGDD